MKLGYDGKDKTDALLAFSRRTEVPLLVLALVMIPLLLAPVALDLSSGQRQLVIALDWFIWTAFALDLVIKTYLAPRRREYLVKSWVDVVIVVVPFLRPLRIVRSARALRVLRLIRVAAFLSHFATNLRIVMSRHRLDYALLTTLIVILLSAVLVARFEADAGGSIHGFNDSLWWAFVTVTTVGYGDFFPVSAPGRAIGVLLMVLGIGLFSLIAANIAAFFVTSSEEPTAQAILEELRDLRAEIAALRGSGDQFPPGSRTQAGTQEQ